MFHKLVPFADKMQEIITNASVGIKYHDFPWPAITLEGDGWRKADIDVLDMRETKKLWMMHVCIYPHFDDPSPIFGWDIISGPKKITGAFHDCSPIEPSHSIITQFGQNVKDFIPSKKRELPPWAKAIFSENMIAASNIRTDEELDKLLEVVLSNLTFFLDNVGLSRDFQSDYKDKHNFYCKMQKENPHTPRVMESLGVDPDLVRRYIETCLFPEVS
ncbi:MAG: hypothetical protein CBB96_05615 [Gammaproteobacteria bacterium TMED36]|nr:MAG: hypothetical protein CBB96_08865 [Gammaproteobacteria bacterium TMED36]OUT94641.1 MAG: hypothetical protein CBB96_05615 [Gammaproteobacteria bacterium TMED36]|tara:strand:+ start:1339 stop:1989 length:651 start_codon:yes stop_codon:yes gene_type:complete